MMMKFCVRGLMIAFMMLLFSPCLSAATVAVVMSENGHPVLDEIVGGLPAAEGIDYLFFDLAGKRENAGQVIARIKQAEPAAVITVGPLATGTVAMAIKPIPVIFCGVSNHKALLKGDFTHVTGVEINPDMDTQLAALVLILSPTKVGVLYTQESASFVEGARAVLSRKGVKLIGKELTSSEDAEAALAELEKEGIDALWMVPDKLNLSRPVFDQLRAYSQRTKTPLYGLTPKLVAMGALFTLGSDYTAMGRQVGRAVIAIVKQRTAPSSIAVAGPARLQVVVNASQAGKSSPQRDLLGALVQYAAETGYGIFSIKQE